MAILKHWAKFLPEAGRCVDYKVERAERLTFEVIRLRKELERALSELRTLEAENEKWLSEEWTIEEFEQAKNKAQEAGFFTELKSNG